MQFDYPEAMAVSVIEKPRGVALLRGWGRVRFTLIDLSTLIL